MAVTQLLDLIAQLKSKTTIWIIGFTYFHIINIRRFNVMENSKRLYHYTTREALSSILRDKKIKPTEVLIDPNERPAVWCSYNPVWEETANKSFLDPYTNTIIFLNREQTHLMSGGLVRVEVSPSSALYNWTAFKRLSGISKKSFESLKKVNHKLGINADSEWRVSFEPIQRNSWLSIEIWDGDEWQSYDINLEEVE